MLVAAGTAIQSETERGRQMTDMLADDPTVSLNDYWFEFYVNQGLCSLCGNTGVIDTTGVKTPAGVEVGRKNWCICPNGQAMRREHYETKGHHRS
jgi:hypothetical protein